VSYADMIFYFLCILCFLSLIGLCSSIMSCTGAHMVGAAGLAMCVGLPNEQHA
jgi:hypothetical protein